MVDWNSMSVSSKHKEKSEKIMTVTTYDTAIELYNDAIKNGGFFSSVGDDLMSTFIPFANLEETRKLSKINDKLKENIPLTLLEKEFIIANKELQKAKNSGINANSTYELGTSVRGSAGFMVDLALTNKAFPFVGMSGVNKLATATSKIPWFTKGINAVGKEAALSVLSPSNINKSLEKQTSSLQVITDDKGNEIPLTTASQKYAQVNLLSNSLKILTSEINILNKKESLTDKEKEKLSSLYRKRDIAIDSVNSLVDANGQILRPEYGAVESTLYAITDTAKERFSEKFVGGAVDNFIPVLGKAISKYTPQFIKKPVSVMTKPFTAVSEIVGKGRKALDKAVFGDDIGLLSKNLIGGFGSAKILHSLPAEMVEEISVQLVPNWTENYKAQLEELSNPDFYVQVLAQTAIMGGAYGSVGGLANATGLLNKSYRDKIKNIEKEKQGIKDEYKKVDSEIIDEQQAQDIAMNTRGTLFSVADYNGRVAQLRDPEYKPNDGTTFDK
ncbi:hypothetical protein, partial [Romboutsia sp.]|uniref:hypothetical protein n=1 Tax=Romboutsia sp. TaxID=1965302 RepID=UPI003F3DE5A3